MADIGFVRDISNNDEGLVKAQVRKIQEFSPEATIKTIRPTKKDISKFISCLHEDRVLVTEKVMLGFNLKSVIDNMLAILNTGSKIYCIDEGMLFTPNNEFLRVFGDIDSRAKYIREVFGEIRN